MLIFICNAKEMYTQTLCYSFSILKYRMNLFCHKMEFPLEIPFHDFFLFKLIFVFQISAQESRRKKKEYMDSLERKYDIMQSEANSWKSKAEALQAQNAALAKQVTELQQKLNMATKTGSEISFILPESIDLEDNLLQGEPSTLSKQLKKHDENICL